MKKHALIALLCLLAGSAHAELKAVITSQGAVTSLTTAGSSGASTLTSGVLNIPVYSGGSSGIAIGTTVITGGTTTTILFDNAGVAGEYTISGTGSVCMTTNCVLTTPNIGTPSAGVATNLTGTASGLTAGNVTTNANLTGVITSVGNATSIASQTGTGTKFVVDTSAHLVTPDIGVAIGTSLNLTLTSTGLQLGGANGINYPTVDSTVDGTIAIGSQAFANPSTSAAYNAIAIGEKALAGTLTTAAIKNTAVGFQAGLAITSGASNTLVGWSAQGPSTGSNNTAIGAATLLQNAQSQNTVIGASAEVASASGGVAVGYGSKCGQNGFGTGAVCIGQNSGGYDGDVSIGNGAGVKGRTSGIGNIAIGQSALSALTTGAGNVVIGYQVANATLNTGSNNILLGTSSAVNVPTAGTNNFLNIGNLIYGTSIGTAATPGNVALGTSAVVSGGRTTIAGHVAFAPTDVPAVTSCGSGALAAGSTDNKGQITGITAATACTITFSSVLPAAPACSFSSNAAIVPTVTSLSTSAVTTTMAALTGTLYYMCQ